MSVENNNAKGREVECLSPKEAAALRLALKRKPGPRVDDLVNIARIPMKMIGRGPTIITDNLVLGSRDDSQDYDLLLKLGTSHVLNLAAQLPNVFEDSFVYKKIELYDSADTDIRRVMPQVITYLNRVERLNGRAFIHCISGVSRSVTVLIMYLIMEHSMRLVEIYDHIKRLRPFIAPNDGFKLQLALCEVECLGFSSVAKSSSDKDWNFYSWNKIKNRFKTVGYAVDSTAMGGVGEDVNICVPTSNSVVCNIM